MGVDESQKAPKIFRLRQRINSHLLRNARSEARIRFNREIRKRRENRKIKPAGRSEIGNQERRRAERQEKISKREKT
jgi:hypothetical protein